MIVTNSSALTSKYGQQGFAAIQTALGSVIAADGARGLTTTIVFLDNANDMSAFGGAAVTDASDPAQNKAAINAAAAAEDPDYLVILGSTDVVPHQDLANPAFDAAEGDVDPVVWSDLPYACPGAYSRNIRRFLGPTRVVGRIPDITGATDPDALLKALQTSRSWASRPAADYAGHLAVSADVWRGSSVNTLQALYGASGSLLISPPEGPNWTAAQLAARIHFFNCHGAPSDPRYYGQSGKHYPEAHDAKWLSGKVAPGVVATAECCYGAELYNPYSPLPRQVSICNTYLSGGAFGVFGSTTIAYGPSTSNDWADLICRYFVKDVLGGASLGRATLQARQHYIAKKPNPNTIDLKTIAQFNLLGDPSIHPVAGSTVSPAILRLMEGSAAGEGMKAMGLSGTLGQAPAGLTGRRLALAKQGAALRQSVLPVDVPSSQGPSASLDSMLRTLAAQMDMAASTVHTFEMGTPRSASLKKAFAAAEDPVSKGRQLVHIAMAREPDGERGLVSIRGFVARELDGVLVGIQELQSR